MKRASRSIQAVILVITMLFYLIIGVYAAPAASTFVMNPSPSASSEGITPSVNDGNNPGDPNIDEPSGGWDIGNWVTASNISDIEYNITIEGKGHKVEWRSKTNAFYTGNVVVKSGTGFHRYVYSGSGKKSDSVLTGPEWRKNSDDPWELKNISHITFNFEVVVTTTAATVTITQSTTEVTQSTTEVTQSTTEVTQSTTEVTQSTTEVTQSTTEVTRPTTEVTQSTTEVTQSTTEVTQPTTVVTEPTTVVTQPTTVVTEPTTVVTQSTTEVTQPTTVVTEPTTVVTQPTTVVTEPTVVIQTTTTEAPVTTTEAPVTTTEAPVTTTEAPLTTTEAPTTEAPTTTTVAPEVTTETIIDNLIIPEGGLPPVEVEEVSISQPDEEIVLDSVVPLGDLSLPQTDEQIPYENFAAGTLLIALGWIFRKLKI